MTTFSTADVTVAVLNYNGRDIIPDLFASIRKLEAPPGAVIMVDDGSTDGSRQWVTEHYPEVRIASFTHNSGGMLNVVRNRALQEAQTPLVFLVDNDVVLTPDCVEKAVEAMNTLPEAVACMTRAVYEQRENIIYQDGQILHYVGASPNLNRDRDVADVDKKPRLSIGWGSQLINKEKTAELGWFNEDYYMGWGDDGEFNHKLNMAGRLCYHVPASVVIHKRHTPSKRYAATVSNRWRFLLEMYKVRTLLLITPALLFYEGALFFFLLLQRRPLDYLKGMATVLRQLPSILKQRKFIQSHRKKSDRQLMGAGDIFIYSDEMDSALLQYGYKLLNKTLSWYWKIVHNAI